MWKKCFQPMIQNAGKFNWKFPKSLSKDWIFLFVITKKQTLVFCYTSSMQLNIEIRQSVWFLTTHAGVLGVSNSDQTRTRYVNISTHLRVRFCRATRTRRLNWLLYSQCFAGNPALKILKSKGEYQTAISWSCGDMENSRGWHCGEML